MKIARHIKVSLLVFGDIVALYGALFLTLFVRYGRDFDEQFIDVHALPFTVIFPLWLVIFYIAGLYDLPKLRNNIEFIQLLSLAVAICGLLTITAFYLFPIFTIAPKTNLFVFILIFGLVEVYWRQWFNRRASFREGLIRVFLLDKSPLAHELHRTLLEHPQMGYTVTEWLDPHSTNLRDVRERIRAQSISLVIVSPHLRHDRTTARFLYELLSSGIEVHDTINLFEAVHRRLPIEELSDAWFIEHNIGERKFYDDLKRALEAAGAIILGICLLPILLLIALGIRITSPGPAIFRQQRVGTRGRVFTLYKFRSMKALASDGSAETDGPVWTGVHDSRTTAFGRFLRWTHLDELPQLLNVMRGDLSFVGPRPERPEIVERLVQEIPYYEIRQILPPGITGWAQINFRKDATTADVAEKLSYDIYYLKNRSLVLDAAILVKTIKSLFVNHE